MHIFVVHYAEMLLPTCCNGSALLQCIAVFMDEAGLPEESLESLKVRKLYLRVSH